MRRRRTAPLRPWPNGAGRYPSSQAASIAQQQVQPDPDERPTEQLGEVRIARRVLRTVVEQAALSVAGVVRLAKLRSGRPPLFGRALPRHGVSLAVHGHVVAVDLYLIVAPGTGMVEVGAAVQESVAAAIAYILGMGVGEINVYIQDVA